MSHKCRSWCLYSDVSWSPWSFSQQNSKTTWSKLRALPTPRLATLVTYRDHELKIVKRVIFRTPHAANLYCCTLCPIYHFGAPAGQTWLCRLSKRVRPSSMIQMLFNREIEDWINSLTSSLCSKQCVDWVKGWIGWLRMHLSETLNRLRWSYFLAGFVTLLSCHRLGRSLRAKRSKWVIKTKGRKKRSTLSRFSVHNKKMQMVL